MPSREVLINVEEEDFSELEVDDNDDDDVDDDDNDDCVGNVIVEEFVDNLFVLLMGGSM